MQEKAAQEIFSSVAFLLRAYPIDLISKPQFFYIFKIRFQM